MLNLKTSSLTISLITNMVFLLRRSGKTNKRHFAGQGTSEITLWQIKFSVTFDTVDHEILLDVLDKQYGTSGNALKSFNSYLQKNKLCVNKNKRYSKSKTL